MDFNCNSNFLGRALGRVYLWGKPRVLWKLRGNCCENYYRDYGVALYVLY